MSCRGKFGDRSFRSSLHSFKSAHWIIRVLESGVDVHGIEKGEENEKHDLDELLSLVEVFCITATIIWFVGYSVYFMLPNTQIQTSWVNRFFSGHLVLISLSVAISAFVRWRNWKRFCSGSLEYNCGNFNLIGRIEELEADAQSSIRVVQALSRKLEKLGIKFRVTRKFVKGPIEQTSALTQKNFEEIQILVTREDILKKELGEIQNVMLAIQEQQRKMVELILAVYKLGKLKEKKQFSEDLKCNAFCSTPETLTEKYIEIPTKMEKDFSNDQV